MANLTPIKARAFLWLEAEEKVRDEKHEKDSTHLQHTFASLNGEEARSNGCWQPLLAEDGSPLGAGKERGTSVLQPRGSKFCLQLHELGRGSFPRTWR